MNILMRKNQLGHLVPADAGARETLAKVPQDILRVKVSRPRNVRFHRKFFAMLTVVMEHMPEESEQRWPTTERLLWELKCQTGRFDVHTTIGGRETVIPHSIAFDKMSEDEFSKFYSDCLRVICRHVIPGIDDDTLRHAAERDVVEFAA